MVARPPTACAAATRSAIASAIGASVAAGGCVAAAGAWVAAGVQAASSIKTAIVAGKTLCHRTFISSLLRLDRRSCSFHSGRSQRSGVLEIRAVHLRGQDTRLRPEAAPLAPWKPIAGAGIRWVAVLSGDALL